MITNSLLSSLFALTHLDKAALVPLLQPGLDIKVLRSSNRFFLFPVEYRFPCTCITTGLYIRQNPYNLLSDSENLFVYATLTTDTADARRRIRHQS